MCANEHLLRDVMALEFHPDQPLSLTRAALMMLLPFRSAR